ncbi:polysaccharide deacetylase family protein [Chryseobacterium sp.]|nr:polysaccharide deacetylase family protein [Chryseobacterium sp.]
MKEKIISLGSKFQTDDIAKSYPLDYCIPVYHAVSDGPLPHLRNIIQYKTQKEFEKDLDILSRNFQFVSWDEFKDFHNGYFKPKKKIALLTFDDGLVEFHDVVVPILERKGIYAVNFINPAFIGNQDLMFRCKASLLIERVAQMDKNTLTTIPGIELTHDIKKLLISKIQAFTYDDRFILDRIASHFKFSFTDFLIDYRPYMTLDQLHSVVSKGFGISNHGFDHPLYNTLEPAEQIQNTVAGHEFLTKHFNVESFAFPFTDYGVKKEFFDEIYKKEDLFCTFGSAGLKLDSVKKNLQRIPMENGKDAAQILKEEIAYFKLKKLLNKNTIHRK